MAYSRAVRLSPAPMDLRGLFLDELYLYLYFNNGLLVFLKLQITRDANMHIAHSSIFTASLPKSNAAPQVFFFFGGLLFEYGYEYRSDSFRGLPWVLRIFFFPPLVQLSVVGQGLLVIEASRSHSHTPHSVGFLSTSDQPVAATSLPDNTQLSQQSSTPPTGIRTRSPSKQATADPRLRPLDHWDRLFRRIP